MADEETTKQAEPETEVEEDDGDALAKIHKNLIDLFRRLGPQRQALADLARTDKDKFIERLARVVPGTIVAGLQSLVQQMAILTEELANRDLDHEDRLLAIESSPMMLAQSVTPLENPEQLDDLYTGLLELISVGMGEREMTEDLAETLPAMREAVQAMQVALHTLLGDREEEEEEPEGEEETADGDQQTDGTGPTETAPEEIEEEPAADAAAE